VQLLGYDNMNAGGDIDGKGLQEWRFPAGHGLTVGRKTPYSVVSMQIHFNHATEADRTGFVMRMIDEVTPNQVGTTQLEADTFQPMEPREQHVLREVAETRLVKPINLLGVHFHYHSYGVGGMMQAHGPPHSGEAREELFHTEFDPSATAACAPSRDGAAKGLACLSTQTTPTLWFEGHQSVVSFPAGSVLSGHCAYNTQRAPGTVREGNTAGDEMCNIGLFWSHSCDPLQSRCGVFSSVAAR